MFGRGGSHFVPLDEIFVWNISKDGSKEVLSVINGDGSGLEFSREGGKLRATVTETSSYHRIVKGDVYEFLEDRAGGMIFKKI